MIGNLCDSCTYYVWSEELEEYECLVTLDEDEYARMLSDTGERGCRYYRNDDEYGIVKKQA